MSKKFYIDNGHGGTDPGAVNGKFKEHEINVIFSNKLAAQLKAYGHEVKLEAGNLSLSASAKAADTWGADFLISCHENAGGGDRGEVIYSIRNGSQALANAIAAGLKKAGQTKVNIYSKKNSTGTADYYGILRGCKCPAVIVEPCFIDNGADRKLIDPNGDGIPDVLAIQTVAAYVAGAIAQAYK